jgi:hypothetical protein
MTHTMQFLILREYNSLDDGDYDDDYHDDGGKVVMMMMMVMMKHVPFLSVTIAQNNMIDR